MLQLLADWPLAAAIRRSGIVYPLVNAAHIAGIGLLLGAIVTLDLRVLGLFRAAPLGALGPPLARVAAGGLALAVATGFLLFSTRPLGYAENPAFLLKLGLVALGVANALLLPRNHHWSVALAGGAVHISLRAAAFLSILIWLGAVLAGRWIGFLQ